MLWVQGNGRVRTEHLASEMICASFDTYQYNEYLCILKRQAKKLNCPIEELSEQVDEEVYEIVL